MGARRFFHFNWTPPRVTLSLVADGPLRQEFREDTGEYTPDLTAAPLAVQPVVGVTDTDFGTLTGRGNASLTGIRWRVCEDGEWEDIVDGGGWSVTVEGDDAGRLEVRRNAVPGSPLTLEFSAVFPDPRTGQGLSLMETCQLFAETVDAPLSVTLDAGLSLYDPLSDGTLRTVAATVRRGTREAQADSLLWETVGDDGEWHTVGTDDVLDYDTDADGDTLTVDRRLMGSRCDIRVTATLGTGTATARAAIVRRTPAYVSDIQGVPADIPQGTGAIRPRAAVSVAGGALGDCAPETLLPLWYVSARNADGSLDWRPVAHGANPSISTDALDPSHGAALGLDVFDRGFLGAWTDTDGAVVTDTDGAVFVIH